MNEVLVAGIAAVALGAFLLIFILPWFRGIFYHRRRMYELAEVQRLLELAYNEQDRDKELEILEDCWIRFGHEGGPAMRDLIRIRQERLDAKD